MLGKTLKWLPSLMAISLAGQAYGSSVAEVKLTYLSTVAQAELRLDAPVQNSLEYKAKVPGQKSELLAIGYAVLPGYFIPAAFGLAYAGATAQASVVTSARVAGRIMWMYQFVDSFFVDGAEGSISGSAQTMLYAGLALDIAGYLYDIIFSPIEVARYNERLYDDGRRGLSAFVDIVEDGPCCGLAFRF